MIKAKIIKESDSSILQKQIPNFNEVSVNKKTKINKNEIERNLNAIEDKAQDCNAYMKIKHFLANQVMEIEKKIEEKDSFIMGATIKINNLTHIIENFRNKICLLNKSTKSLKEKNRKLRSLLKRSIDFSEKSSHSDKECELNSEDDSYSDEISSNLSLNNEEISCYSFEKLEKNEESKSYSNNFNKKENKTDDKSNEEFKNKTAKYLREIEKLQKIIKNDELNYQNRYEILNKENFKLSKRNFLLNAELNKKNSEINNLENKNVLILNELIELVHSLRTIDIRNLNKIYLENLSLKKKEDLEILNIPSCLGIKYNILSAESFLSYLINTKNNRNRDEENMFESLKENFPNSYKHLNIDNYQMAKKNENLLYKGKCNFDFEFTKSFKNNNLSPKSIRFSHKNIQKKKVPKEDDADLKINKNYLEDRNIINQKNKKTLNEKSLYKSLFDVDDSDSIYNDSSLENYLEANYPNDNNPFFIYELSKENIKDNNINDLVENQYRMTSKIMNISKYEKELNSLLDKNLKKTKLLSYTDSE